MCVCVGMDPIAKTKLVESLCKVLESVGILAPTVTQVCCDLFHNPVLRTVPIPCVVSLPPSLPCYLPNLNPRPEGGRRRVPG